MSKWEEETNRRLKDEVAARAHLVEMLELSQEHLSDSVCSQLEACVRGYGPEIVEMAMAKFNAFLQRREDEQ